MNTSRRLRFLSALLLLLTLAAAPAFLAQETAPTGDYVKDSFNKYFNKPAEVPSHADFMAQVAAQRQRPAAFYYAIAASIGIGCLSAGYAVGKIGAAVMGAAAEKPEIMGKAIAFVGLGEGIALFGFLVALFLYTKM